jgi:hypothetical protein
MPRHLLTHWHREQHPIHRTLKEIGEERFRRLSRATALEILLQPPWRSLGSILLPSYHYSNGSPRSCLISPEGAAIMSIPYIFLVPAEWAKSHSGGLPQAVTLGTRPPFPPDCPNNVDVFLFDFFGEAYNLSLASCEFH